MEDRILLIYLNTMERIGWKTIERLYSSFHPLTSILDFTPFEISMGTGIDLKSAERVYENLTPEKINLFLYNIDTWKNRGIEVVTILDKHYPRLLKEIAQPPWVLYTVGNTDLFSEPSIAIVGTRNPTAYGITIAEKLSKELATFGWVITSGMARGIDKTAHEAVLENTRKTIAVLGSGIDVIYPKENLRLYNAIAGDGLIVSEYAPGTKPSPGMFPQRNRIISGLSYGTIVIEASLKSGSLITAQHALDQSREVFSVPGPISSKQSLGTNALIQQGAKLIVNVGDVMQEFPYLVQNELQLEESKQTVQLSKSEQVIYSLINEKIHIDELINTSNLSLSEIYECLLALQLKGRIKQLPGGYYRIKT